MNIKKLDEKDVIFVDQPWSDEDRKQLTALLQKKKTISKKKNTIPLRKHQGAATHKTI